MKQIYFLLGVLVTVTTSGCLFGNKGGGGADRGEVLGVAARSTTAEIPVGMAYIPSGTFLMGQTDQDITFSQISQTRQVTIPAFFMDQTEITNSQYRQFVNWVRDSIAITSYLNDPKYYLGAATGRGAAPAPNPTGKKYINWKYVKQHPPFSAAGAKRGAPNPNIANLQRMFYQDQDRIFDRNELDVRLLKYNYAMPLLREAANNRNNPNARRSDFILRDTVAIYPDTLVWLSDFSYAANEPMVEGYFSHPSFRDYPVVGVTWRQARAFTIWRTRYNEAYKDSRRLPHRSPYELPTEQEFEYAARGGRVGTSYPWGGPYIKNAKGCLLANFKPGRGNYSDDGGTYTVKVRSYFPNDFNLYNMAGNVAEWTQSAYDASAPTFVNDLAPTFNYEAKKNEAEVMKRKVVRGGSWKDVGYFLQNSARTFEYQDSAKSYIGFRCVTHFQGRDLRDKR
ncbi:MAG: SUMF1/EgtB/PvdO family nonheme iron enzyme [Bacteroidota bacterium]